MCSRAPGAVVMPWPVRWPAQHVPQFWLGVTAAKQARLDDAKQHLRNALFYAPDFFPALHNLGSLLLIQVRACTGNGIAPVCREGAASACGYQSGFRRGDAHVCGCVPVVVAWLHRVTWTVACA